MEVFVKSIWIYLVASLLLGLLLLTNENRFGLDYVNIMDNFANVFITTSVIGIILKIADDSKLIDNVIDRTSSKYSTQIHDQIENYLTNIAKENENSSVNIIKNSIKECTKECSEKMTTKYGILKEAEDVGLEHIFFRKAVGKERGLDFLFMSIQEQIDSKIGEIYIVGIAALEIFPVAESGDRYGNLFKKYLEDDTNKCKVKVLLLDPDSKAANLKAKLEFPHDTVGHIRATVNKIEAYQKQYNTSEKLIYKRYSSMPIALLFLTSRRLFLEPYPNVDINKPKQNLSGPIGGRTPMIVIKSDTEAYNRWKAHIEHLWEYGPEEYPGNSIKVIGEQKQK